MRCSVFLRRFRIVLHRVFVQQRRASQSADCENNKTDGTKRERKRDTETSQNNSGRTDSARHNRERSREADISNGALQSLNFSNGKT